MVASYLSRIRLDLAPHDGMYHGNDTHYLCCGASALNVILAAQTLARSPAPESILDFGAGAGRVTRWLAAAHEAARISTCDLREEDMEFNRRVFGAEAWVAGTEVDILTAPATYDLIWLGSVATHLSATKVELLLDKMLSWTNEGGVVAMSLHGRYARKRQSELGFDYIDDETWRQITVDYDALGFGYADYEGQDGYGISLTKLSWAAELVEARPSIRLITLSEKVWDDHHDVLTVQKQPL